jgi:hypothetical protein
MLDRGGHLRRDLRRPPLVSFDDPVAGERLFDLGERAVGRDRHAALEADRLCLRRVDESPTADDFAARLQLLIEFLDDAVHVREPLGRLGRQHLAHSAEHHHHVFHFPAPSVQGVCDAS